MFLFPELKKLNLVIAKIDNSQFTLGEQKNDNNRYREQMYLKSKIEQTDYS